MGNIEIENELDLGNLELDVVKLGSSGASDYNDLTNKPQINSVELVGNKSLDDLNIQSIITDENKIASDLVDDTESTNKFVTEEEKLSWSAKPDTTFKAFENSFDTTHTTQMFLSSIADTHPEEGVAYLGEATLTDFPSGIGNAEIEVYVHTSGVYYCVLRSANVSPYLWDCNNHTYRGWEPVGSAYANSNFLSKTNSTSYTPTESYNPATKKYVDDAITSAITGALGGSY